MTENVAPKNDGAGGGAPSLNSNGAVLCVDGAEARVLRKAGHTCITASKMRRLLGTLLHEGHGAEALNVVGRLGAVSNADNPEAWPMWKKYFSESEDAARVRQALADLPTLPTPLRDPVNVRVAGALALWKFSGTTVLVSKNTFELVRAADTYAKSDIYRPRGRMDEPFQPQPGRVCLVTEDELRLLRLNGLENVSVVVTFKPEEMTGGGVARWPSSIRALCGEFPALAVGVAPFLVAGRHGWPFVMGLTRGVGYETTTETGTSCAAAVAYCYETNQTPETVAVKVVVWAGGDDVRQLVRYGGLTIFTGHETRRKVQLRSLGLAKSGTAAGAPVYDLAANYNALTRWAITRTFAKPEASHRDRDHRRVRPSKALPQSARGMYIIQETSPRRIKVTVEAARKEACNLRRYLVGDGGRATPVHLISLVLGGTYYLNGRAKEGKEGDTLIVDAKRSKIRCPRWTPADAEGMLKWLTEDKSVVFAGKEADGLVFAVVKVANGTEDQQREAVTRWSQLAGLKFTDKAGCASWIKGSIAYDSPVTPESVTPPNWRALSLETACFERYQTAGDYGTPLKLTRTRLATPSERARAYVDAVPLADEGTRNQNLHGAAWNVGDKFGAEALRDVMPYLLAKSTLPQKEKRTIINRALTSAERKPKS